MDRFYLDQDYQQQLTTGCDEVGRGCIAGPVVTAAVSWVPGQVMGYPFYTKLRDSKELSQKARDSLYAQVLSAAKRVRVAVMNHMVVDRINVLRASLLGFERTAPPYSENDFLFIDGNQKPPGLRWAKTLIKGENKMSAIAGASVVAKVVRDEMMRSYSAVYPGYGFEQNVGYPTPSHKKDLEKLGPCPIHRKTFKPLHPFVPDNSSHPTFQQELSQAEGPLLIKKHWTYYSEHYFEFAPKDDVRILSYFDRLGFL